MKTMWSMLQEVENLRREIDRAFQNTLRSEWQRPLFRFAFRPAESDQQYAGRYPLLNISEDEDKVYVDALAPGIDPKSLKIQILAGQLQLSGEKKGAGEAVRPEAYHRNERAAGGFTRSIGLPAEVDQDKATAEYRNGILRISLPKAETAKPRQISIKVA